MKQIYLARVIRSLIVPAILIGGTPVVFAQDEASSTQLSESAVESSESKKSAKKISESENSEIEEVVATGTRLNLEASQIAKQLITFDTEALLAIGEPDLARTLARLPQNFGGHQSAGSFDSLSANLNHASLVNFNGSNSINLRGMGNAETLVLVNGSRMGSSGAFGGSNDISGIPMEAVERIDIIMDGASAIYGSDAVGGVVNIILKTDYEGLNAKARYGAPTSGGMNEKGFNFGGTTSWDSGSFSANVDMQKNTKFQVADSSTQTTPPFNGVGPNGMGYSVDPNVYGETTKVFYDSAGVLRDPIVTNDDNNRSLTPDEERLSLAMMFNQELSENLKLNGNVLYMDKDTSYDRGTAKVYARLAENSSTTRPSGAFNPLDERVYVRALHPEQGIQQSNANTENISANLNLEWNIAEAWRAELRTTFARNTIDSVHTNPVNTPYVLNDWWKSTYDYNPFGGNSQAVLDKVFLPDRKASTENKEKGVELLFRGALFELPAGHVSTAFGASHRTVNLSQKQDTLGLTAGAIVDSGTATGGRDATNALALNDLQAKQEIESYFAEFHIPLLSDKPFARQLDMSYAFRYDDYKNTGASEMCVTGICADDDKYAGSSTFDGDTYSYGLVWAPTEWLRFKADVSTSFVSPSLLDNFAPVQETGVAWVREYAQDGSFVQWWNPDLMRAGGNPDLKPQQSKNKKFTTELQFTDDLKLSVYYTETTYKDKIMDSWSLISLPGGFDAFSDLITYSPDGTSIELMDRRIVNLNREEQATIDVALEYGLDTAAGRFDFTANLTEQKRLDQYLGNGVPSFSLLGSRTPKKSAYYGVTWSKDNWFAGWNSIYRGNRSTDYASSRYDYDSTLMHNLNVGYRFNSDMLGDALLSLKMTNITEEETKVKKYVDDVIDYAYSAGSVGDSRGRMIHLELSTAF